MDNVKQQIVDRLKQANNILVTVKSDPSIDLLSACIGLALVLGKLDKHAAAVFSGEVPSAMEFLKPEETLEPTTNSLRDFIISLDKAKADKLRYKVEDKVVRIFITPYRTSLTQDDLEFSQGDFNIDVVVALGVKEQAELDAAITAHGRILHDATVVSINNLVEGSLGSLNWLEAGVSSVSEMITDLVQALGPDTLDDQIATALLTGIVAETRRFSNDKTTPQTMRAAGELMAAGANQQLVANELQADSKAVPHGGEGNPAGDDGTLDIAHAKLEPQSEERKQEPPAPELPAPIEEASSKPEAGVKAEPGVVPMPEAHHDDSGENVFTAAGYDEMPKPRSYLVEQPDAQPSDAEDSEFAPYSDPAGPDGAPLPLLNHTPGEESSTEPAVSTPASDGPTEPGKPAADTAASEPPAAAHEGQTLEEIEASVGAHAADAEKPAAPEPSAPEPAPNSLDDARSRVLQALSEGPQPLKPLEAIGAHPFPSPHEEAAEPPAALGAQQPPLPPSKPSLPSTPSESARPTAIEVDEEGNLKPAVPPAADIQPMDLQLPPVMPASPAQPPVTAGTPPPPEPPPLMPPSFMGPPGNKAF